MSFAMTQEWRSKLLRPRLVREDVFVQGLTPDELGMIREASERGLKPSGFEVAGNTLILRFDRKRITEAFAGGVSDGRGDKEIQPQVCIADRYSQPGGRLVVSVSIK